MNTDQFLHQIVANQRRAEIMMCFDHDLAGPKGKHHVYATCRKCGGRFKVEITEEW